MCSGCFSVQWHMLEFHPRLRCLLQPTDNRFMHDTSNFCESESGKCSNPSSIHDLSEQRRKIAGRWVRQQKHQSWLCEFERVEAVEIVP